METLFLMRHGETAWNNQKRVMGRLDVPLNREGTAQTKRVAKLLPDLEIHAIYSSPLKRALDTALILAGSQNLTVETDANLTEVAFGRWEGYRFEELIKDKAYHRFLRNPLTAAVPGGETIPGVQQRGLKALRRATRECPNSRLLFVSHGDVIRAILCHYLKLPLGEFRRLRIDNGSLSAVEIDASWAEVKFVNYLPNVARMSKEPYLGLKPNQIKGKKTKSTYR